MKIIYDLGANVGQNLLYYLKKAERVVAVEANPILATVIAAKFAAEIQNGRLSLDNRVVTAGTDGSLIDFYIHDTLHLLSQLGTPNPDNISQFTHTRLPCVSIGGLLEQYGNPHYVKIDLEHHDAYILRAMFHAGYHPQYVSAEAHSASVLDAICDTGTYSEFQVVDGRTVPKVYRDHLIHGTDGVERFSFPHESAGPYGEDLPDAWLSRDVLRAYLRVEGYGWKDLHARIS